MNTEAKKIAFIDEAHPSAARKAWKCLCSWWRQIAGHGLRQPRRLRLGETLPLGDRRFLAVVEFEKSRFLVGATSTSLVLLTRLESNAGAVTGTTPPATEKADSGEGHS